MAEQTLETRLRRLEDLEEIRRLHVEYGRALDARDFEAYCGLFTEDGEFVSNGTVYRGREAIRGMLDGLGAGPAGQNLHLFANPAIELRGDRATATLTWAFVVAGEDGRPALRLLGRYSDVLRRDSGRWRFERREATGAFPARPRTTS